MWVLQGGEVTTFVDEARVAELKLSHLLRFTDLSQRPQFSLITAIDEMLFSRKGSDSAKLLIPLRESGDPLTL